MAVNKFRDDKNYRGLKGKLIRFFEQKVDVSYSEEPIPLKTKMNIEFKEGMAWNITGKDGNFILSTIATIGITATSFVMGIGYFTNTDALEVSRIDDGLLTMPSDELRISNDGTIISLAASMRCRIC